MPETEEIRWLIAFAQGLCRSVEEGEDLAQDVLVALAEEPTPPSRGLLAAVTRNLFKMRQRARGRRLRREISYANRARDPVEPTEDAIAVAREVQTVLEGLDEPTRALLVARHLEERTAEEIAADLGEPPSTVRTRLARARKRVREDLDARWRGDRPWAAIVAVPWSTWSKATAPAAGLGGGSLLTIGSASLAALAVAVGCAWALPEDSTPATETISASPDPVPAQTATRINPDPRREAILRARERRRASGDAPPPPAALETPEDSEASDPIAEVLEAAFLPLEPSERAIQSCLDAAPANATGVASVRAKVIGEPSTGAVIDSVEILEDAGQPELVDCMVEALFAADFPDPRDIVFDDYVFEANLDTRLVMTTSGIGPGQLLELLAVFPELEEEVATMADEDPETRPMLREELAVDPEAAADFPALQDAR